MRFLSSLPPDLAITSSDCYLLQSLLPSPELATTPGSFLPLDPILDSEQEQEQELNIGQELDG